MSRSYFYTLDTRGRLFHDGTELNDTQFLDFFFRRLKANDTRQHTDYPYVSPCAKELNYCRPLGTPIVFRAFAAIDRNALVYGGSLHYPFAPEALRFTEDGSLYHPAPLGEFGLLSPELLLELGCSIQPWGPFYSIRNGRNYHVIAPLPEDPEQRIIRPGADNACVGCGAAHPEGFALSFLWERATRDVYTWLLPDERMQGKEGWMHGGYIALLMDEIMGKALSANDMRGAPTARLTVNYRRPARLGRTMKLRGSFRQREGRKFFVRGEMYESAGGNEILLADAEGLFVATRPAE